MRSGWKGSIWSSFSPMPANLMGLPVTAVTESAAPPRASPSSFVSMTPVMSSASSKALRGVDRVLAGHGVDDQQYLGGLDGGLDVLQLVHERLVNVQAAGRVEKDEVVAVLLGVVDTGLGNLDRVALAHLENGYLQLRADGL